MALNLWPEQESDEKTQKNRQNHIGPFPIWFIYIFDNFALFARRPQIRPTLKQICHISGPVLKKNQVIFAIYGNVIYL